MKYFMTVPIVGTVLIMGMLLLIELGLQLMFTFCNFSGKVSGY